MSTLCDPFAHHPELRGKIVDPLQSNLRHFTLDKLEEEMNRRGLPVGWWRSDDEREEIRARTLAGRLDRDLWVFAYGSLMWNPAFQFAEVRRAFVPDYARRFILKDVYGGRGTFDEPGLMAALDEGTGCEGLLFRIDGARINNETEILWRREQMVPAYIPTFVDASVAGDTIKALAFVADHGELLIDASLSREQQIHCFATGTGFLGTSADYLRKIASQFETLGIVDEDVSALLHDTETYIRSKSSSSVCPIER